MGLVTFGGRRRRNPNQCEHEGKGRISMIQRTDDNLFDDDANTTEADRFLYDGRDFGGNKEETKGTRVKSDEHLTSVAGRRPRWNCP